MKQKLFTLLFAVVAGMGTMFAEIYSGTCGAEGDGSNLQWTLANGVLSITGAGKMHDYNVTVDAPWYLYRHSIDTILLQNGVTSIGAYAFKYVGAKSIHIPGSLNEIGYDPFMSCSHFTEIVVDSTNSRYDSRDNCNAIIETATNTLLRGCQTTIIPNSVTNIERGAFHSCMYMTHITIPENITQIGQDVFCYCSSLDTIIWNAKRCSDFTNTSTPFWRVKSICDVRTQITSFEFGEEVEYIPAYLCYGMTNIQEIVIHNCKVEIGAYALANCNYRIVGVDSVSLPDTVICYPSNFCINGDCLPIEEQAVNDWKVWSRTLTNAAGCDSIVSIKVFASKLEIPSITVSPEQDYSNSGRISFNGKNFDYFTVNDDIPGDLCCLKGGEYKLTFFSKRCKDDSLTTICYIPTYAMRVDDIYYNFDNDNHTAIVTYRGKDAETYTEYRGDIIIPEVVSFEGEEYQVVEIGPNALRGCNNINSITIQSKTPLKIGEHSDTRPGIDVNTPIYVPYGSLNTYKSAYSWKIYNLHVINSTHVEGANSATSATITFGNTEDQKHIISCGIEGGESFVGFIAQYISLEPNSQYNDIPFFVNTIEGDYDTLHYSFSTTALELTTQPSKPVSSTTAILLANTNMADAEVSCGFEWKRNDAPADMAGTKVYCPVADGTMAGRLKNLKDDVYYKYRAFYESAAGNMYYGDWQYIFTGDNAVEFDPVLYTYAAAAVTETTATLKGYALAGSDDFTEQGFEYWAESRVPHADNAPARMPAALGEHQTVQTDGISMRVTLTGLDEGTAYKYRTYAKIGSQTVYGSEMSFTTKGEYSGTVDIETVIITSTPDTRAYKILRNGQIFILRGEKVYTVTGQEVR